MKRALSYILAFIVIASTAHYLTLAYTPTLIMSRTFEAMQERGMEVGKFRLVPQSTPQNQSVVRPSPDLAYSVCLFDFEANPGPIEVQAAPWRDMGSLSFFDADTNNFKAIRIDEEKGSRVIMYPPSNELITDGSSTQAIIAPSKRGIILIRRLAPTVDAHAGVAEIAEGDVCGPINRN